MHIMILCVGSAGDVYPFIAIGQELVSHDGQLGRRAQSAEPLRRRER